MGGESGTAVDILDVMKQYGVGDSAFTALTDMSLDIQDNEFFTLLGPSGCGKTTLLRMIAGFETVTQGQDPALRRRDRGPASEQATGEHGLPAICAVPAHDDLRRTSPSACEMLGKEQGGDRRERSKYMLELVQLGQFGERRPSSALRRPAAAHRAGPGAWRRAPKVLLLDEPLSALDFKLRQAMRAELKQMQQETGITFVFVTHDQEEALTMSDRIAVMSAGELQQVGTAHDIYEAPRNRFVADFIGETNLLDVTVEEVRGEEALCRLGGKAVLPCSTAGPATAGASRARLDPAGAPEPGQAERRRRHRRHGRPPDLSRAPTPSTSCAWTTAR